MHTKERRMKLSKREIELLFKWIYPAANEYEKRELISELTDYINVFEVSFEEYCHASIRHLKEKIKIKPDFKNMYLMEIQEFDELLKELNLNPKKEDNMDKKIKKMEKKTKTFEKDLEKYEKVDKKLDKKHDKEKKKMKGKC